MTRTATQNLGPVREHIRRQYDSAIDATRNAQTLAFRAVQASGGSTLIAAHVELHYVAAIQELERKRDAA